MKSKNIYIHVKKKKYGVMMIMSNTLLKLKSKGVVLIYHKVLMFHMTTLINKVD